MRSSRDRGPSMAQPEQIRVRVVYALPDRQPQVEVTMVSGGSVAEAVARSGLVERFGELQAAALNCAIFGRVVAMTEQLRDGDRVEILRPLLADAKENRRKAAASARAGLKRS